MITRDDEPFEPAAILVEFLQRKEVCSIVSTMEAGISDHVWSVEEVIGLLGLSGGEDCVPVVLVFRDGRERRFPGATGACKRGGLMLVRQEGAKDLPFDASEVVSATVTLETGEEAVELGGAESN